MTTSDVPSVPPADLPSTLVRLLHSLPDDVNFQVGMDQILKVQALLVSLAARNALPSDPQRWCYIVAPIVCTRLAEQEEFYRQFQQILPQLEKELAITRAVEIKHQIKHERRLLVFVALAGALIWLCGSLWYYGRQYQQHKNQSASSAQTEIILPKKTPANALPSDENVEVTVIPPKAETVSETPHVISPDQIPPAPPAWYWIWLEWLSPLAVFVGLIACYSLWKRHRVRLFLERQQTVDRPSILGTAQIAVADQTLFLNSDVASVSRQLRQRVTMPSTRMDVDATVDRTAKNNGQFSPRYGTRQISPEYIVIVERIASQDHLAELVESFLARLKDEEVHFERFWYVGDLLYCHIERNRRPIKLQNLINQNPDARLLVCGRARAFFHQFTGRPAEWTQWLERWPQRVLLTTDPITEWGYQEWCLSQMGFVVLPLTLRGITRLGQRFDPNVRDDTVPVEYLPKLPAFFTARWEEFSSPEPPDVKTCAKLMEELQSYLGQRLLVWFSACAIYPQVTWELTLYLGQILDPQLCTELNLGILSRLPWMRAGSLPDWLRRLLIGLLLEEDIRKVRFAIDLILLKAIQGESLSDGLKIAEKDRNWLSELGRQIFQRQLQLNPDDEELRDSVYASFVTQPSIPATTYATSRQVSRLLQQRFRPQIKRDLTQRISRAVAVVVVALLVSIPVGAVYSFFASSSTVSTVSLPDQLSSSVAGPGYGSDLKDVVKRALADLQQNRIEDFVKNMLPVGELSYLSATRDGLPATIDIIQHGLAPGFSDEGAVQRAATGPLNSLLIQDLRAIDTFLSTGADAVYNADHTIATFQLNRAQLTGKSASKANIAAQQSQVEPDAYGVTVRFQLTQGNWRLFDGADEIRRTQRGLLYRSGVKTTWQQ